MDPLTKRILAEQQIKNAATLLNGKLSRLIVSDHSGKVSYKLVIEYEDPSNN